MLTRLLKLSHCPRWIIIDTYKEQSVADHSFRVIAISVTIADWLQQKGIKEINWIRLYEEAMLHDIDESRTGDIPPTFKALIRDRVGASMYVRLFPSVLEGDVYERQIVKVADLIETITFAERYLVNPRKIKKYLAPLLNNAIKTLKERTIKEKQVNLQQYLVAYIRDMISKICTYD